MCLTLSTLSIFSLFHNFSPGYETIHVNALVLNFYTSFRGGGGGGGGLQTNRRNRPKISFLLLSKPMQKYFLI